MEGNIIKMVKQFKYLGTKEESKGIIDAEVKKRIGTMYTAYNKFDKVTFSNKHLSLKTKLEMFVCMVIPAGTYNCSCWNLNAKQLKKFVSVARRLLTRLINFKGRNYISYDYILKLTHILGAINMVPMHLLIQRQRMKLFGHIIRMKDDRQVKQLLLGEIDGVGFRGRPYMQWIDCIRENLETFNISNNPKEECQKIRDISR
jgi:hypothetical protein